MYLGLSFIIYKLRELNQNLLESTLPALMQGFPGCFWRYFSGRRLRTATILSSEEMLSPSVRPGGWRQFALDPRLQAESGQRLHEGD